MIRTRQILAVTLVATALAADRAVAAAVPSPVQQASMRSVASRSMAGRIVSRLSSKLRHSVPAVRLTEARPGLRLNPTSNLPPAIDDAALPRLLIDPFQFRLPPPAL